MQINYELLKIDLQRNDCHSPMRHLVSQAGGCKNSGGGEINCLARHYLSHIGRIIVPCLLRLTVSRDRPYKDRRFEFRILRGGNVTTIY